MDPVLILLCAIYLLLYAPYYVALSNIKKGAPRKAYQIFRRMFPVYSCMGRANRGLAHHNLGVCLSQINERAEALQHFQIAIDNLAQSHRQKHHDMAIMATAASAFLHADIGNIEEGERLAEIAQAKLNPNARFAPNVTVLVASTLFYAERFQEAEALLNKTLEFQKLDTIVKAVAYSYLAQSAYYQGHFTEAFEYSRKSDRCDVQLPYFNSGLLARLIVIAVELGDIAEAKQAEAKLVPMLQKLEEAHRNTAYVALSALSLARGDLDRTLDYAERGYNQHATKRELANSLYLQASVYAQRKNYVRALQLIQEAETYPNFTLYRERLANLRHEVEAIGIVKRNVETNQPLNQIGR